MSIVTQLFRAPLPSVALSLYDGGARVAQVAVRRGVFAVPRAGEVSFAADVLKPSFDEQNIFNRQEIAEAVYEVATKTGLAAQKRWSVALPEAATRTGVVTLEAAPTSNVEMREMLAWKIERAFGARSAEMRFAHQRLSDENGKPRFLASAIKLETLNEYESIFDELAWHAGLMLPAHLGDAVWLMNGGRKRASNMSYDSLILSSHAHGFTANVLRGGAPVLIRNILCEPEDSADEFYRLMLFYRDRLGGITEPLAGEEAAPFTRLQNVMVTGAGLDETKTLDIIHETLAAEPRTLTAADVSLSLNDEDLNFATLAAPAGLASLAFRG